MSYPLQTAAAPRLGRLALLAALAAGAALPASATVFTAYSMNVYRDGTSADWLLGNNWLLRDSFDNGDPFTGSNYSSTGLPASYTVQGLANAADVGLAVREQGGALMLDSSYGAVAANAQGGTGTSLRLRLQTSITDPNAGLPVGKSFATSLRLALSAMPDVGQSFGFRLTDINIGGNNNDVIELFVNGGANGDTIVFRKQDFDNHTITVLGTAPLLAPGGAAMLVLSLSHSTPASNLIFGSYGYADASGTLMGGLSGFGNSAVAFQGEGHTRIELRSTGIAAAVPEPASWALMGSALGLCALMRRRPRQGR